MLFKFIVSLIVVLVYGSLFNSSIHSFDLSVSPRIIRQRRSMLENIFVTNSVKCVRFDKFICFLICMFGYLLFDLRISWIDELTAIISEDIMDSERHILN